MSWVGCLHGPTGATKSDIPGNPCSRRWHHSLSLFVPTARCALRSEMTRQPKTRRANLNSISSFCGRTNCVSLGATTCVSLGVSFARHVQCGAETASEREGRGRSTERPGRSGPAHPLQPQSHTKANPNNTLPPFSSVSKSKGVGSHGDAVLASVPVQSGLVQETVRKPGHEGSR